MLKHVADAGGLAAVIMWFINHVIPIAQPLVIFTTALLGLAWYGVRFYQWFKHGRIID